MSFLRLMGVNKAVFWAVLSKVWAAVAGIVTISLIIFYFSPELQGYYYTFASLLGLQVFIELGLSVVIILFASHEWAKLSLNEDQAEVIGDPVAKARLKNILLKSLLWFAFAGMLLFLFLNISGYLFFSSVKAVGVSWFWPWIGLCFFTALNLAVGPIFSVLEGCNQIYQVYFFRFIQGLLQSLAVWILIVLGFGLWSLVGASLMLFLWSVIFVLFGYRQFFLSILRSTAQAHISWWKEIWPMQWKIALSGLSGFFLSSFLVPVVFRYQGSIIAGQAGMTLNIINALVVISNMWFATRVAQFGILVAKKEYKELDRLYFHALRLSLGVAVMGGAVLLSAIYLLYYFHYSFSSRLLSPWPTFFFLLAFLLIQLFNAQAHYFRAHKQEPFVWVYMLTAGIIAFVIIGFARNLGILKIAAAYFFVILFVMTPLGIGIWRGFHNRYAEKEVELIGFLGEE
ncbi:MAG: hypothetical protein NT099_09850 [Candidatus Saganbacteria bacterium]|nr:hypothetical protein [Candidatus Saganbacteria bacterium]